MFLPISKNSSDFTFDKIYRFNASAALKIDNCFGSFMQKKKTLMPGTIADF